MSLTRPDGRINFRNCLAAARAEIDFAKKFVAAEFGQTNRLNANQIAMRMERVRFDVEDERERIATTRMAAE